MEEAKEMKMLKGAIETLRKAADCLEANIDRPLFDFAEVREGVEIPVKVADAMISDALWGLKSAMREAEISNGVRS